MPSASVIGATNGGAGPSAGGSVYDDPHTLPGTTITAILTDANALRARTHRAAVEQRLDAELYYWRDSVWAKSPAQPILDPDNPLVLSHAYRQPLTCAFAVTNEYGLLTPENKESSYNYNGSSVYDPLFDEARKILIRLGTRCWTNLASAIAPTSTLAPTVGTLASLTDGALADYSAAAPSGYARFDTVTQTFTLKVDLATSKSIKHAVVRFGSKSGLTPTALKLPVKMRVGVSVDDVTYTWMPYRPVGGDGTGGHEPGDWDDNYYGIAVEIPVCDIDLSGRYVKFEITTQGTISVAIDEIAVYGGTTSDLLGRNVFMGYLGDDLDFDTGGLVSIRATGIEKKAADNNDIELTAPYTQTDATDLVHSLLTSAAYWKAQSEYNTAFAAGEMGWSSGASQSGLKYPAWQGQANSVLGYVYELIHSIGHAIYGDGNGIWRKFEPAYRQTAPNRVMIAGTDGNNDVRHLRRRRTGKDMRNTVNVATGQVKTGASGSILAFEPNSVNRYGPRRTRITDPILTTQQLRQKVADYFLRDYAWRLQTIAANIQPDFETRVRDVHGFRAILRPKMYSHASTVSGKRRVGEVWMLEEIEHRISAGSWTADCLYMPYFPFATDAPNLKWVQTTNGVGNLIPEWDASTDPAIASYKVYVSATSEVQGFKLAATVNHPTVTTTITNVPGIGNILVGTRYWVYVTAVNAAGYESLPSQILNIIAGTAINTGTDCDGSGNGSGYVINDFDFSLLSQTGPDDEGYYTYKFYADWTSPTCGHTQHKTGLHAYNLPSAEVPALNDDTFTDWEWRKDEWDWWDRYRVPVGKMWDKVTTGKLSITINFRTKTLFTAGQRIYARIWNSKTTNWWRPVASNYDYHQF